jgi:hypothetical protein
LHPDTDTHNIHVLCVLCVVDSFSAIGGPHWRYILANISQAWPSMTLVDRLPGPHATARSRLMAKRKVPFVTVTVTVTVTGWRSWLSPFLPNMCTRDMWMFVHTCM